jgi:hypothetical protein
VARALRLRPRLPVPPPPPGPGHTSGPGAVQRSTRTGPRRAGTESRYALDGTATIAAACAGTACRTAGIYASRPSAGRGEFPMRPTAGRDRVPIRSRWDGDAGTVCRAAANTAVRPPAGRDRLLMRPRWAGVDRRGVRRHRVPDRWHLHGLALGGPGPYLDASSMGRRRSPRRAPAPCAEPPASPRLGPRRAGASSRCVLVGPASIAAACAGTVCRTGGISAPRPTAGRARPSVRPPIPPVAGAARRPARERAKAHSVLDAGPPASLHSGPRRAGTDSRRGLRYCQSPAQRAVPPVSGRRPTQTRNHVVSEPVPAAAPVGRSSTPGPAGRVAVYGPGRAGLASLPTPAGVGTHQPRLACCAAQWQDSDRTTGPRDRAAGEGQVQPSPGPEPRRTTPRTSEQVAPGPTSDEFPPPARGPRPTCNPCTLVHW